MIELSQDLSNNKILGGHISILQPLNGFRVGIDSILLASSVKNCTRCLEIGSGSGVISLCLAKRIADVQILGIEHNVKLVDISRLNIQNNALKKQIKILCLDIMDKKFKTLHNNYFDQVVMNPPYFSRDSINISKNIEITSARYGSKEIIENWINIAYKKLIYKGRLNFVFRTEYIDKIIAILNSKWGDIRIFPLWPKAEKDSKLFIIQARKDVKSGAKILPGMILHNKDGSYTESCNDVLINKTLVHMD